MKTLIKGMLVIALFIPVMSIVFVLAIISAIQAAGGGAGDTILEKALEWHKQLKEGKQ